MSGHVFALSSASVPNGRYTVTLHAGEVWDADDEIVQAHPHLFSDTPPKVRTHRGERPVEQATAAPGEKRKTTKRA